MEAISVIINELGIPKQYVKECRTGKNRIFIAVHCDWITSLLTNGEIPEFITHDSLVGDEIQSLFYDKEKSGYWHKLLINVFVKPKEEELVIPLPRARAVHSMNEADLSFAQLLHYVSETNFKNMWKQTYKKHIGDKMQNKNNDSFKGSLLNRNNNVLIEIIKRFYGCRIIKDSSCNTEYFSSYDAPTGFEAHPNILPAICAIETKNFFLILHYIDHVVTLKDCITFSPTLINTNYAKPLFVIYQLLQIMKNSHDKGLILGNLQLDDIFVNDSLFIQVIPNLEGNICKFCDIECELPENIHNDENERFQLLPLQKAIKPHGTVPFILQESNLELTCKKWINKEITNFEYLMHLNYFAGRRFGDPACHFIMPWVSDFTTRTNGNWRDLSKSKFRINKGDRQLDLTYENALNSNQVPHHVSDVLSEITYYVYLSRRTPRSILCKYVRSVWVPAEYPSSIQRLQEWTPDECIPEFFYDPTIFKSIHEDLPNLELPHWALTPEEFIDAHRECLESKYVSERLHHWIDLTFGYKLSGSAAIKAKNVCLHLVESHRKSKTAGVVQLFHYPHPPREAQMQFHEKVPPKILSSTRQYRAPACQNDKGPAGSEDEGHSSGNGEDDSFGSKNSPLIFSKLISRSKGSLLASFQSSNEDQSRSDVPKSSLGGSQTSNSTAIINLPKEFNPSGLLTSVETNQNFFRKTFLTKLPTSHVENKKNKIGVKQIVANKRMQEMQVIGCLIIEIFLQSKVRVIDVSDLEKRLSVCASFSNHESLPRCLRSAVSLLLQSSKDLQCFPCITSIGLPPPSAHQLLQPLLSSFIFPFPKLFSVVYSSVCNLIKCSRAITEYKLCNPQRCQVWDELNVSKVKKFNVDMGKIWDELLSAKNDQVIDLVFPFIKELLDDPLTSRLSTILFLDKVCRCLGPKKTNELLLETIINLYNSSSHETCENLYLYHKKFLLILIVRCGLKVFLENFVGPLMEVVGKYKDSLNQNWDGKPYSVGNDTETDEEENTQNLEVDWSPDIESRKKERLEQDSEVEVFAFDQDDASFNSSGDDILRQAVEHLDLNLTSDLDQQSVGDENTGGNHLVIQSPEINISSIKSIRLNLNSNEGCAQKKNTPGNFSDNLGLAHDYLDLSQIKASEVAGDSILWLAHRLGPVLTSRYLSRNLLRVLSLCFTGNDNLEPYKFNEADETNLWKFSVLKWKVIGDENVETVLRVLGEITELYGEQIILLQYLPFMTELINLSKKKFTLSLEGGVIGCLTLLKYIVPFMNDTTLMDYLQDVILKTIIHPTIRLVSTSRYSFPSGQRGRYTLVAKLIDCIYLISLRIGTEMTKAHIAVPALQRFFLAFNKAHGISANSDNVVENQSDSTSPLLSISDNRYLEIQRDGSTTEWSVQDIPGKPITFAHIWPHESFDASPCEPSKDQEGKNNVQAKALDELSSVFDTRLAHQCYGTFCRFLGETTMENTLKNQNFIRVLYCQYEKEQLTNPEKDEPSNRHIPRKEFCGEQSCSFESETVGSFGRNVAVVGNKIELQTGGTSDSLSGIDGLKDTDISTLICKEKKDTGRHLRGNWLAYWEHEIGRSEKDNKFNFKQIKLQSFTGHANSVRMIHCLENENSFMSGSKDKTVKLWSLRSQGDGSILNGCQYTYIHHRKSLLSFSFIPSIRIVASCDSTIHLWDPFEGKTVSVVDNAKVAPINVLKALNPPSCNLIAATTDATLKIVDARICSFVSEYKISLNSVGLIRSICVSPNDNWIAVGQASGLLTILDVRTGMVLASWKGHEAEVLQLVAINDSTLMSSSLDQTISAWDSSDGKFKFYMKGPAEPVHCLAVYNSELITGTTANRIGVHTSIDAHASFSSTKLRSDAFKGILTSMTVLPLNKLLLLGADNGNITLLC